MAGPQRILLIDDDERLARMVVDYLRKSGFAVEHCPDAASGLARLQPAAPREPPEPGTDGPRGLRQDRDEPDAAGIDAVILDLMLPDMDGLDVCRIIRARTALPVLMLTARGDATDRVVGLEIGADDYLPKPFDPRELLARLRAVLRRTAAQPALAPASGLPTQRDVLRFGRLEIDRAAREARLDGRPVDLTSRQFALLEALAGHAGRVLSRDRLMDLVRGEPLDAFDRSIDVHVSRIRAAIEDDPRHPRRILTVRGAGYVFARHQDGDGGTPAR